jgi:hypothetical protein
VWERQLQPASANGCDWKTVFLKYWCALRGFTPLRRAVAAIAVLLHQAMPAFREDADNANVPLYVVLFFPL